MLALHYVLIFFMLYLSMFHLMEIPQQRKSWYVNLIVIGLLLLLELIFGIENLHDLLQYLSPTFFPIYEFIYSILAIFVILYIAQSLKKILLILVLYVFIIIIVSLGAGVVFTIFGLSLENLLLSPWYSSLGAILGFILFICLYPVVKFMKINRMTLRFRGILFMIFGLISYGYYLVTHFKLHDRSGASISTIVIGLLALIGGAMPILGVIAFVGKENNLRESEYREKLQTQNYKLQKQHYMTLQKKGEETRKFRHDINKRLRIAMRLLHQKKLLELENYFETLAGEIKVIENHTTITTGSDFVDAFLEDLLSNQWYENVKLNNNWVIPTGLVIEPMDMTLLFVNLFTNAFEATTQCSSSDQFVQVKIDADHHFLAIRIENSYMGELEFEGGRLRTTKGNKKDHGYGTQIIRDIVEKYDGIVKMKGEAQKFSVLITFDQKIYMEN